MKTKKRTALRISRANFRIDTWEERDRLQITAYGSPLLFNVNTREHDRIGTERELACWVDDDARSMFEDGFFQSRARFGGHYSENALERSVYDYLSSVGVIYDY